MASILAGNTNGADEDDGNCKDSQMDLGKFAKAILPNTTVASLRHARWKRARRRVASLAPLSETVFRGILTDNLNVGTGDVVYVHSGMDALNLDFPFYRVLFLIQEIIGPAGTVLFPTYPNHQISSFEYLRQGNTFDIRRTPSYTGILTEFARRQRCAVRSLHPTKSVCGIGSLADEITATHHLSPYPYDECSPYYKLIEHDAKIIGLGVSTTYLSFSYCVDDALKEDFPVRVYHDQLFEVPCINYEGFCITVSTYAHDMNRVVHVDMPHFMKTHVSNEACEDLTICGMSFFRADARKLFAEMMTLVGQGITTYPRSVYGR